MKREILFKGKRVDNGEWVEGNLLEGINSGTWLIQHWDEERGYCMDEVIPDTISQFTGLTDKNGVKIFEGDYIVCYGGLRLEKYPDRGVVVYNVTSFCMQAKTCNGDPWKFSINFSDGTEIEVIGNIHDNHELLKQ